MADQSVAQPTGRAVLTPSTRNDIPEAIPKVVSIKAGEGPADTMQEFGVRRAMTPAPTPVATDAVPRQPQSTPQVLQQPQVYDKQTRDVPRTVARAGEGPCGLHARIRGEAHHDASSSSAPRRYGCCHSSTPVHTAGTTATAGLRQAVP